VIVVADASPLRYLILIEEVRVLPALYGRVIVPPG
jgi:predicted nucleic acid-binding protein